MDYFNITESADSTGTTAIAKRRAPNAHASDRKQAPLKYYKPDGARAQPGQRVRKFTR